MTEQIVKGYTVIPRMSDILTTGATSFINALLDANNESAGFVIQAPKTGTISKVGFRTGTVTTGDTVDVRLETVSTADGNPTGTLLGANSNASQVIDDADDNTWFLTTLTTGPSVTKGDIFAVVIVNSTVGNMNIVHLVGPYAASFPYVDDFVGGSWTKDNESCLVALEYDDGSYEHIIGAHPVSAVNNNIYFNSGSDPDHRGLKFKFPFPFRITGIWVLGDMDGPIDVILFDSDGITELESINFDNDLRVAISYRLSVFMFGGTQSLSKDTFYRVVIAPSTATGVDLDEFDVDAAAIMDCFEGGQNFHYTEKKDAGWTDTTTKRPWMGLLIDGYDDGVGGGGGGGMKLVGIGGLAG